MGRGVGRVFLVGAGPGDPRLLTLRAKTVLASADVVVYDRLIHPNVMDLAPGHARHIYVGKEHGKASARQDDIHAILLEHAKTGAHVVRLKGGDPLIFGRGGEEAEFLRAHQIDFEIVPGLSASSAALTYAGIPMTHRHRIQGATIVAGYSGHFPYSWQPHHTWIIMMGLEKVDMLVQEALAQGFPPQLPACAIEWGTWGHQRLVASELAQLPNRVVQERIFSPGVLVWGENASMAREMDWFASRVDYQKRILILTRYPLPFDELLAAREDGAEVLNWSMFWSPQADLEVLKDLTPSTQVWLPEAAFVDPLLQGWTAAGRDVRDLPSLQGPDPVVKSLFRHGVHHVLSVSEIRHDSSLDRTWTLPDQVRDDDPLWRYQLALPFEAVVVGPRTDAHPAWRSPLVAQTFYGPCPRWGIEGPCHSLQALPHEPWALRLRSLWMEGDGA
ncbi:MAG: uroporphyrinogen-III C-methyltransferase [Sulfobacillus thermotolerans]|uniref:uroporphyrinogen-III C-methyltransferase n=1 Tax=Sulfobacillus thermotolerans TaxID=338644 RepID=A0ABN5H0V2_9FIRM|nr:uroporphyrinogen-III C-methyltransferase [Sulfobacillus thermotolerans]MCY0909691.1 uroporphyrinogen-III C-methyltransferase [Sulfobacillus thermotolerans]